MLKSLKYLLEPVLEYPVIFWPVVFAVLINAAIDIAALVKHELLRKIPLSLRLLLLLGFTAAMAPMAVEAFESLVCNKGLPTTVEGGVEIWPTMGFIGWVSFLNVTLTFLVFQLWEPWKEELLVKIPSKLVNYIGTGLLAGAIHSCSLVSFLFIYSYQREIPLFTTDQVLLIGFGQVGFGLSISLWLRTIGSNRFISDFLGLALSGVLAFWAADYLGIPNGEWIFWICSFSTFFWAFWGLGRFIREMIRFRQRIEGETVPFAEEAIPPGHVCLECDREFVTLRGLNIHMGRMHKKAVGR